MLTHQSAETKTYAITEYKTKTLAPSTYTSSVTETSTEAITEYKTKTLAPSTYTSVESKQT